MENRAELDKVLEQKSECFDLLDHNEVCLTRLDYDRRILFHNAVDELEVFVQRHLVASDSTRRKLKLFASFPGRPSAKEMNFTLHQRDKRLRL